MTKITNINKIIFHVEADGSSGTVPSDEFYGEIIKNQLKGEGKSTVPNWKKHVKVCEDLMLLLINWCCVPSPQSKRNTSELWDNFSAKEETFLVKVGTPELVPKNVIFTYINIVVFLSELNLDF